MVGVGGGGWRKGDSDLHFPLVTGGPGAWATTGTSWIGRKVTWNCVSNLMTLYLNFVIEP